MTHFDLTPFYRSAIGVDRMATLVDSLFQTPDASQPKWPPYNIEKHGETQYRITMAVAGFCENDLEITTQEQKLIIIGKITELDTEQQNREYLYRGIAARQFERRFQLADFIHIKGASLKDGLLHIDLEREVPEAMKPRKIDIVNNANLVECA